MDQWYYADTQKQQQGPVDLAALRTLVTSGAINGGSLVWRTGTAAWVPAAQIAELGIVGGPPPMPQYAAAPNTVAGPGGVRYVQPKSSSILLPILLVGFGAIPVIAILAAIAIPAYQDFLTRARITQAIVPAAMLKGQVDEYVAKNDQCPSNNDEGFMPASSYETQDLQQISLSEVSAGCSIRVSFKPGRVRGGDSISFIRDSDGSWTHETDIPSRYLPLKLRN
jgi:type IV pilus assembly protein PilA